MIKRAIVILHNNRDSKQRLDNYISSIYDVISRENDELGMCTFFVATDRENHNFVPEVITIPKSLNSPASKNLILSMFKDGKYANQYQYLYIIEDDVQLANTQLLFPKIENVMSVMGAPFWVSTACNPKNYIFDKFSPRIILDMNGISPIDKLLFAGYDSTELMCWDIQNIDAEYMHFWEELPNLYMIEYAHRMNKGNYQYNSLCFYPTFAEEATCIRRNKDIPYSNKDFSSEIKLLEQYNIIWKPDVDIDKVILEVITSLQKQGLINEQTV